MRAPKAEANEKNNPMSVSIISFDDAIIAECKADMKKSIEESAGSIQ
jgi:hypothetical protein